MSPLTDRPLDPIVRWAGGKRWLIPEIRALLTGVRFKNYYEPFLGGASIFLAINPPHNSSLSDLNADLIETYREVAANPEEVHRKLLTFENSAEAYYEIRAKKPETPLDRAARFLFLNHTSFNGIHRVNLRGEYNVPYGYKAQPNFPRLEQLRLVASRFSQARLLHSDFRTALSQVGEGDLVFLDPPYTVAHNSNGFVKYNQTLFSYTDQEKLSIAIDEVKEAGAHYILTNAAHSSIRELFSKGDLLILTQRQSAVGGAKAGRGIATEYLFTNLKRGQLR